jgi:hypothetical protein
MRRESEERARQVPAMRRAARRLAGRSDCAGAADSMEDRGPYQRMRCRRWCRDHADGPIDTVIAVDQFHIARRRARSECTAATGVGFDEQGQRTRSSKHCGF